jgi:hypothetical protein
VAFRTVEPAPLLGFGDLLLTGIRVAGNDKNCQ